MGMDVITTRRRVLTALAVAIVINLAATSFVFWYLHGVSGIYCTEESGTGFPIAPECPEYRRYTSTVLWLLPLLGAVTGAWVPIRTIRLVPSHGGWWLMLGLCIPVIAAVVFIISVIIVLILLF
jgi:hypothetical protein